MATSGTLEEHITCHICYEIYTDPHDLKCRHTFCLGCIQRLTKKDHKVQCPECRKLSNIQHDIQKDFKTQALIEFYHRERVRLESLSGDEHNRSQDSSQDTLSVDSMRCRAVSSCEVCNIPDRPLLSKCENCDQFMCESCDLAHRGITICRNHLVVTMEEEIKRLEDYITDKIETLRIEKAAIACKLEGNETHEKQIIASHKKQLEQVDKMCREYRKDIDVLQKQLNASIDEIFRPLLETTSNGIDTYRECEKQIDEKIGTFIAAIHSKDMTSLIETIHTIRDTMDNDLAEIQEKTRDIKTCVIPKVTMKKTHLFTNAETLPNVQVNGEVYDTAHTQIPDLYLQISPGSQYERTNSVTLNYESSQICMIDDDIWCAGGDAIYVYNSDCEEIRRITHRKLQNICNITQLSSSGEIFVACNGKQNRGIHQLDKHGKYVMLILKGSYSSIYSSGKHIYAFEKEKRTIVKLCMDVKWTKVQEFKVKCTKLSTLCRVSAYEDAIYLSSFDNQLISVFNEEGQCLRTIGESTSQQTGKVCGPFICGMDNSGNGLVCDYSNHKLQVFTPGNKWYTVTLDKLQHPIHAMVDYKAEFIWVVTQFPHTITKFTKKDFSE